MTRSGTMGVELALACDRFGTARESAFPLAGRAARDWSGVAMGRLSGDGATAVPVSHHAAVTIAPKRSSALRHPGDRSRGEPPARCPTKAAARRPTSASRRSACASSGRCSRPPGAARQLSAWHCASGLGSVSDSPTPRKQSCARRRPAAIGVIQMSPKQSLNRRRSLEESDRPDRAPRCDARIERLRRLQRLPFGISSSQRALRPNSRGNRPLTRAAVLSARRGCGR